VVVYNEAETVCVWDVTMTCMAWDGPSSGLQSLVTCGMQNEGIGFFIRRSQPGGVGTSGATDLGRT
jgi:hypothetical protein